MEGLSEMETLGQTPEGGIPRKHIPWLPSGRGYTGEKKQVQRS